MKPCLFGLSLGLSSVISLLSLFLSRFLSSLFSPPPSAPAENALPHTDEVSNANLLVPSPTRHRHLIRAPPPRFPHIVAARLDANSRITPDKFGCLGEKERRPRHATKFGFKHPISNASFGADFSPPFPLLFFLPFSFVFFPSLSRSGQKVVQHSFWAPLSAPCIFLRFP